MGIKICPDCQGKVSDQLSTCPHCGHPFATTVTTEEVKMVGVVCPSCGSNSTVLEGNGHYRCKSCDTLFMAAKTKTTTSSNVDKQKVDKTEAVDLKHYSKAYRIKRLTTKDEAVLSLLKKLKSNENDLPSDIFDLEITEIQEEERIYSYVNARGKLDVEKSFSSPFTSPIITTLDQKGVFLINPEGFSSQNAYKFNDLGDNVYEEVNPPEVDLKFIHNACLKSLTSSIKHTQFTSYKLKQGFVMLKEFVCYIVPQYKITYRLRGNEYKYLVSALSLPDIIPLGKQVSKVSHPSKFDYQIISLADEFSKATKGANLFTILTPLFIFLGLICFIFTAYTFGKVVMGVLLSLGGISLILLIALLLKRRNVYQKRKALLNSAKIGRDKAYKDLTERYGG